VGINSIKGIRSYLPIAFEIHITVDVSEDFSRVDKFREDCVKIELPIVLDLEMKEGSIKDNDKFKTFW
jgi:hypothetical protein